MLKRLTLLCCALVAVSSLIEYVRGLTPLEQILRLIGRQADNRTEHRTVIRLAVASWQATDIPWQDTIRRYEAEHPAIKVELSSLPDGAFNSILLSWSLGRTDYDAVMAFADQEIHPFITYHASAHDPAQRGLIVNVRDYLTAEQIAGFEPALLGCSSRTDPGTGAIRTYALPWMGEVLALNYNKQFFAERGVTVPRTWNDVERACEQLKGLTFNGQPVAPLIMDFSQSFFFAQNCYIPLLCSFKAKAGGTLSPSRSWAMDERGRLDVSSSEAVTVFETLKRWYDAGYITPNAFVKESISYDLQVGRGAMYPHWQSRGFWAMKTLGPETIGIAASPGSQDVGALMCTYGAVIPKASPVIGETVAFCYEAFCTDRYGFQSAIARGTPDPRYPADARRTRGGGPLPVARDLYDHGLLPPGMAELGKGLRNGYSYPDPANWNQCSVMVAVEFEKYLAGEHRTAREALAAIQKRFDEEVY